MVFCIIPENFIKIGSEVWELLIISWERSNFTSMKGQFLTLFQKIAYNSQTTKRILLKFSGIIQNTILPMPTNFQPMLFTQPNQFLGFLAFRMAFFLAFFLLNFLVRQSDTLF